MKTGNSMIRFETGDGVVHVLHPVYELDGMPRLTADPRTGLHKALRCSLSAFMQRHGTRCLTDGAAFYTLKGGGLALCEPASVQ